ncbi:MAG: hypothetical protein E2600_10090 [Chryseobacterium sp.]|nr:hypothetical protein [Chryseobacterium sp.]
MHDDNDMSQVVTIRGERYYQNTTNTWAAFKNWINSGLGGDSDYWVEKKPYNFEDNLMTHRIVNESAGALVGGVAGKIIGKVASPLLGKLLSKAQINQYAKIGSTGKVGEDALKLLGGESQVSFKTTLGQRYIDQLVNGIANESKVGYTSLTSTIKKQIAKDVELIADKEIKGSVWHFFKSPVTGKVGASKPLLQELEKNNIQYIIHK